MAKQTIGVGLVGNDGLGDPLRNAFVKVNENFTELYTDAFDGAYTSLTGRPTSLLFFVNDGANNQVLTTNGDGTITFQNGYGNTDVDTHLNIGTAAADQVLAWSGTDYEWVPQASGSGGGGGLSNNEVISVITGSDLDMAGNKVLFGNVYDAEGDLPAAGSYHGMFAHVHGTGKAYYAHNGAWVRLADFSEVGSGGGGGSLPSRTSPSATTASIADGVSTDIDITGFKGYALYSITTSHPAWVTLYTTNAARTADNSRLETEDPAPDAGIISEVITSTGNLKVVIAPGAIGYNLESTPTANIPVKVRSKNGSAAAITVAIEILQLEA